MSVNIAVANHKGGVAKTTTTITVAHCCALHGYRVLIVDGDPLRDITVLEDRSRFIAVMQGGIVKAGQLAAPVA